MPTTRLTDQGLEVRLSPWERLAGLVGNQLFPFDAVREVHVEEHPLRATRGIRAPGLDVPRWRKYGTWRGKGRQFVAVVRDVPALRLELAGHQYASAVVSTDDARGLAAQLQQRLQRTA